MFWVASPASALEKSALKIISQKATHRFTVELAQSREEQEQGLMHRATLAKNEGMLFPQSPERVMRMWMKNTEIPLDMLFIDSAGHIVYIAPMTTPNSTKVISRDTPVLAVLELAGGVAAEKNIRVGDRVEHEIFVP